MHELPDDQRSALILSELGDLSHAEVAEVIECEVAKVKSLVFQARSGLIERRQARETPCVEIREQLATLRGGSLRRGPLRRHLKECPGCSEFREEVRRQRQMVAAVLPVMPTLALKENALAAVGIGAGSAGSSALVGGGAAGAFAVKATVAKVAVIAVATTGAVGGAVAVEETVNGGDSGSAADNGGADDAARGHAIAGAAAIGAADAAAKFGGDAGPGGHAGRNGDHGLTALEKKAGEGFEPVQGESNGERARDFASGRGEGQHKGLHKPHPGIQKQTARDGSNNGKAIGRSKPESTRQTPQRPETTGSNQSHAEPAPKPEHPLTPNLLPDLTPSREPKGPQPSEERTPPLRSTEIAPEL
jgi:hypothetical protein